MYLDGHDDDPADGDADIMMAVATARYRKHSHHRYREHKHHNHHHHHHHHHKFVTIIIIIITIIIVVITTTVCCGWQILGPPGKGARAPFWPDDLLRPRRFTGSRPTNPLLELFIRSLLKLSLARGEASVVNHLQPERPQRTSPVIEPALALSLAANNFASGLRQYPLFSSSCAAMAGLSEVLARFSARV